MIGKNQCEHGSLARQCLICELTAENETLKTKLKELECLLPELVKYLKLFYREIEGNRWDYPRSTIVLTETLEKVDALLRELEED